MNNQQILRLYRAMRTARRIDELEQELTSRGEAFFHVAGAGHEAAAALGLHLMDDDWLHCHYRDKALMLLRGVSPRAFFDALYCKDQSHSRGRQMSAHMSDPRLRIMSIVGPVGNSALQAVGVAQAILHQPSRPLVLCSVGDGTTQQGEFLEACGEAVRGRLPVLFLVEDNRWSISTNTTGKTFYSLPNREPREFYGMPIHRIDGRDAVAVYEALGPIVEGMRRHREPALVVLEVERLTNHTNADDQTAYRDREEIRRAAQTGDPLRRLEAQLRKRGIGEDQLRHIEQEIAAEVARCEAESFAGPDPVAVTTAKRPLHVELTHPSRERRAEEGGQRLNMREALRETLRYHLRANPQVVLFGQDIEDPKGDVFGVTRGLSTEYPGRVLNSALSESTILGTAIGRALAGQKPVAFIQFADFLPLAYNQLVSELGSMYWRSDGGWQAGVIVMVACGAYRPGLGPFHAQTFESIVAHVPGVDVFMPCTAGDAAGLLNAAMQSNRPTVFFYPKSCLNDPRRTTSGDVDRQFVPIGTSRKVRSGRDLTLVAWGNTVGLCEQAADALEGLGIESEILDLRCLSPWDERAVLASAEKTARLMVVHEDNHTCGLGAEVLATVAEKTRVPVALRRVTRPDTYVPCNFANQIEVLPSLKRVLTVAAELLDLDLQWQAPEQPEPGIFAIEAIGSGPSDETVVVAELLVEPGQEIQQGQPVASLEATKSVFELVSPVSGTVRELCAAEGETIAVGKPLLRVRTAEAQQRAKPITQEQPGKPLLRRKATPGRLVVRQRGSAPRNFDVGISSVATVKGSRLVSNAELLDCYGSMTSEDIIRLTGIESRYWADEGENAVNLAAKACWQLFEQEQVILEDLNLIICSTTSPTAVTPSMACQVLNALAGDAASCMLQAYDINAACSGYLYALQAGYDFLQSQPHGRVLVVTTEVLSPLLDRSDPDTAILFGDAASATILYGEAHFDRALARLYRPELSAKGEDGSSLSVPLLHDGYIQMKGRKVFTEAVRSMVSSLNRVCQREGIQIADLVQVVPHQANQRILEAIASRIAVPVFSNIRLYGNTSSSSIPLCLAEILPKARRGERIGLCAFGGGFTFGASILEALRGAA